MADDHTERAPFAAPLLLEKKADYRSLRERSDRNTLTLILIGRGQNVRFELGIICGLEYGV